MLNRQTAYTASRRDVIAMVPRTALRILDVGCSDGTLGFGLKNELPERCVVGIEVDREFAARAVERLDRVIHVDLNEFKWDQAFLDDKFDCIIFADVLEHLFDPWFHLAHSIEYLRSGGSVVISMPNIRHISALAAIALRGTFPRRDRGLFDHTHLRWFTIADARRMVRSVNLQISAESYSLRIRDRGGGLLNKLTNRLCSRFHGFFPVREFLTYQFCITATK